MKRLRSLIAVMLLMMSCASAQAITVTVDGRTLSFDQPPAMVGGRVLVPLRGIFESLGATVRYDAATRAIQATRGSTQVQLALGSSDASVNGQPVHMDVPAQTVGGRTMVPLRFVSEALGAEVHWNAASQLVDISSGGGTAGPPPGPAPTPPPTAQQPEITGLVVEPTGAVRVGDVLRVTMTGTPGGRATFDIEGLQRGIAMREAQPGTYRGRLQIDAGMRARRATVIGHLRVGGQQAVRQSDQQVSIGSGGGGQGPGGPIFINVSSPTPGERIRGDFNLVGTATPGAMINVRGTVRRSIVPGVIGVNTRNFTYQGRADRQGNFAIPVGVGQQSNGGTITLEAQAVDRNGRASQWAQFQYPTSR